jgi:hypothetical protein
MTVTLRWYAREEGCFGPALFPKCEAAYFFAWGTAYHCNLPGISASRQADLMQPDLSGRVRRSRTARSKDQSEFGAIGTSRYGPTDGLVGRNPVRRRVTLMIAAGPPFVQTPATDQKFLLHVSTAEQKRRLQARQDNLDKQWKFSKSDLKERALWEAYQAAYEEAIARCSTPYAPWYVVPSNKKWYHNLVVARTIADTLEVIGPTYPPAPKGLRRLRSRIE